MRSDVTRNDEDPDHARPEVLTLTSRRDGGRVVIALVGELDMEGAGVLAAEVSHHLTQEPLMVEIDGLGLAFVDSVGLRSLLTIQDEVAAAGATFGVVASPPLTRLLQLTGLTGVLTLVG
jgi:anti-anti-sigma factor